MSIELLPVGVACQLACPYCYQMPLRDAGNYSAGYDLEAMKRGLTAEGGPWSLFGGEALLMKFDDLAELLRWGKATQGRTSVQTNGVLITERHLDLFDECNTSVGISVDGPDDLNDSRWAGSLEKTREATAATHAAIAALLERGQPPSLIVTIHRGNASPEKLPRLLRWLLELDRAGIRYVRIHPLEIDHESVREQLALSDADNIAAFRAFFKLQGAMQRLRFDLFVDIVKLVMNNSHGSCVWASCDPLTTPAVRGVNGVGGRSNCSRTNKDGVDWVKANGFGGERYLALHETPQEDGGCQGCRFFYACKGQCPGSAIDGDWRNRSEHCELFKALFADTEAELMRLGKRPMSADPAQVLAAEAQLLDAWRHDRNSSSDREHGDHWDAPHGYEHADGHYTVHGDQGLTKTHGDHSDGVQA